MTDGKKEKRFEMDETEKKTYGLGIRHLQMVGMSLTMIALFMARGSMGVAVLAMSDESRKNDTGVTSAILSALPYLGMLCGGILSSIIAQKMLNLGWHSKIFSRKLFTSVALFGVASGLITLSFMGPEQRVAAVATLITTLTLSGAATAGHTVNQLDISPNYAGVLMGFLNFVANIFSACVPLITGLILGKDSIDASRWRIVFLLHAGISIASNLVFMMFGSAERQAWDDPDYLDKAKADPEETQPAMENTERKKEATKQKS